MELILFGEDDDDIDGLSDHVDWTDFLSLLVLCPMSAYCLADSDLEETLASLNVREAYVEHILEYA